MQLNRIFFNIFEENKLSKIKSDIPQRIEFLSFTSSKLKGKDILFETKIRPFKDEFNKYLPDEKYLKVNAREEQVDAGTQAGMERMASMARRFSEWTIAKHVIDLELDSGDIIVKDGSLQTSHTNEYKCVDKVFQKALEKNVFFTGLSKTCRLTTDTRISLIASIQRLADELELKYDKWCYYPVAKGKEENSNHQALIMVVKLNKHSYSPFRFEILKDQADIIDKKTILEIISALADNSKDIRLPGYPYGLIDADLWARVKNNELTGYKTKLYSELSKLEIIPQVFDRVNTVKAHEKLDGK